MPRVSICVPPLLRANLLPVPSMCFSLIFRGCDPRRPFICRSLGYRGDSLRLNGAGFSGDLRTARLFVSVLNTDLRKGLVSLVEREGVLCKN
jgi:hypothetical protein